MSEDISNTRPHVENIGDKRLLERGEFPVTLTIDVSMLSILLFELNSGMACPLTLMEFVDCRILAVNDNK